MEDGKEKRQSYFVQDIFFDRLIFFDKKEFCERKKKERALCLNRDSDPPILCIDQTNLYSRLR